MTLVTLMTQSFLIAEYQQVISQVRLWLQTLQYFSVYYGSAYIGLITNNIKLTTPIATCLHQFRIAATNYYH